MFHFVSSSKAVRARALIFATASMLLTSCSSTGIASLPSVQTAVPNVAPAANEELWVLIRIKIRKREHHRVGDRPAYISPSTQGMTIAFSGPTTLREIIALTPQSPGCSTSKTGVICTKHVALRFCHTRGKCYKGSVATFDGVACANSKCTIPPGAHELSGNQNVAFSVVRGRKNTISLTLDGIPVSVAVTPVPPSTLSGSFDKGFTISKCVTTPQSVTVIGLDADGNQIVGNGAPTPTLISDDTTHLAVPSPSPLSPNTFTLRPPSSLVPATIPNAGGVVHLTASVTPLPGSGASSVGAKTSVTFNSDVCGVISEYAIPTKASGPVAIVDGPDGALWFTETTGNKIGRITTAGTVTGEYSVPTPSSSPGTIAAGPDGALWFTEVDGGKVGRITVGGGINEFTTGGKPAGIAAGPDAALWFTNDCVAIYQAVGRITTGGTITHSTISTILSVPTGIAVGSDGALWFAESNASKIGRITTAGTITNEYATPTGSSQPFGIAAGPDGALWFTEGSANKIGRIATNGASADYSVATAGSTPRGIVAGPDGALWFTEYSGDKIGRITTDGTITNEYSIPTAGSEPYGITVGPDGALWFNEFNGDNVGRLQ